MPLIQTKGAASAQGFGEFSQSGPVTYIEDVFSTYLYTSTGADITITNGIDLSTKGGLVWIKSRSNAFDHYLTDTARGVGRVLYSDLVNGQSAPGGGGVSTFNTNGYVDGNQNANGVTQVSWTFRKQPKFFDIVTYTGDGTNPRTINHNLGSTPGFIIIKCTSAVADWPVWHTSLPTQGGFLNTIDNFSAGFSYFGLTVTSTTFSLNSSNVRVNQNGATYVAYVFANNAGGFGLTGSDNVISCGSFTQSSAVDVAVSLGYEPQWVLVKQTNTTGQWNLLDDMRGFLAGSNSVTSKVLRPNLSNAEADFTIQKTATGFTWPSGQYSSSAGDYIYIAIRRGPMKTPTSGTSVYGPIARTGTGANASITSYNFSPDVVIGSARGAANGSAFSTVLTGQSNILFGYGTFAESALATTVTGRLNNGFTLGSDPSTGNFNTSGATVVLNSFGRAPGFFDVVCYTGNATNRTITHNLTVAPELILTKDRTTAQNWFVYAAPIGNTKYLQLGTSAETTFNLWQNTTPTSTVFSLSTDNSVNRNTDNYVAYLFATCPGVSKVGSYTGTGALQTVDCGFTSGARYILIKRTDSTGGWYFWDSARGISSGNDPYLILGATAAEVTGTNYVDTTSVGFQVTAAAPADLNANGGTYIFLAIA